MENAAQKRLTRAIEKLRKFFAKRGVNVGASGLIIVISANAVQAVPIELETTISAAAGLAATTVSTTVATAIATKAIALTMLQKAIIGITVAGAVGMGVFGVHQICRSREVRTVQQLNTQMNTQDTDSLRMIRNFKASAQLVFDAFTKPEILRKWMFPGPQTRYSMDVRVGGKWSITSSSPGMEVTACGTYIEVKPPYRLVYTFSIPQFSPNSDTITIEIVATEQGCTLTFIHSGVDIANELRQLKPGEKGKSQEGYEIGFEALAKALEQK